MPTVLRMERVLEGGSGAPCLAACDDGMRRVVELSGAGAGPAGLLTEAPALRVAAAFGAPVPSARPALIPEDLPWTAGTDEFDATLRRSWGWNLGIGHVEGAALATARDAARLDPRAARAIAASDRFLANVDRTPRNPNLLRRADGGLVAIDYGACLFLTRALAGRAGAFEHPAGHLLPPAPPAPTPTLAWRELLDDLPDAWIAAAGTGSAGLTAALAAYEAAAREVLGRA